MGSSLLSRYSSSWSLLSSDQGPSVLHTQSRGCSIQTARQDTESVVCFKQLPKTQFNTLAFSKPQKFTQNVCMSVVYQQMPLYLTVFVRWVFGCVFIQTPCVLKNARACWIKCQNCGIKCFTRGKKYKYVV